MHAETGQKDCLRTVTTRTSRTRLIARLEAVDQREHEERRRDNRSVKEPSKWLTTNVQVQAGSRAYIPLIPVVSAQFLTAHTALFFLEGSLTGLPPYRLKLHGFCSSEKQDRP